jgi:catechol 2,3-dioxygenase
VAWFTDVLGLEETTREGQSVYLRGAGEWLHSSLVVTEGPEPALGHTAWRAYGLGDPEAVATHPDRSEHAIGWVDASVGHGPAFRFHAPVGRHVHEVFWDVHRYAASPELATDIPNRPQRYAGRGVGARYIDHVTVASPRHAFGHRVPARDDGPSPHGVDRARAGVQRVRDDDRQRDPLDA